LCCDEQFTNILSQVFVFALVIGITWKNLPVYGEADGANFMSVED